MSNTKASEDFSKNVKLQNREKIILFGEGDYIGFSIRKEYSKLNVIRNGGDNDLYCLIRLGYMANDIGDKKTLHVDCSIQSKFERDYHGNLFGDRNNKDYPEQESYENFKKTRIPFNLSTSERKKFYFSSNSGKFFRGKKETTLRKIIDDIFIAHEKSTTLLNQIIFKYTTYLITTIFEWLVLKFLHIGLYKYIVGGPKIDNEDWISINLHYGHTIKPEQQNQIENKGMNTRNHGVFEVSPPLFGGKLDINKRGLTLGVIWLGILAIQHYLNPSCKNYIINLLQFYKDNEVILGVLLIIWIGIFHILFQIILPTLILIFINITIKIRRRLLDIFYFNGYDYDTGNNPYK